MGWSLPKGFQGYQEIPHEASGPSSTYFEKTVLRYVWALDHPLGALLAQKKDEDFEQAIYYLSKTLIEAESRCNPVEKECLAVVFAIQKTQHYLIGPTIYVISRVNLLRILMTKPGSLNYKLANWAILLSQYDMAFCFLKGD